MKVWIELQDPTDENTAKDICDKANAMMNKLGVDTTDRIMPPYSGN